MSTCYVHMCIHIRLASALVDQPMHVHCIYARLVLFLQIHEYECTVDDAMQLLKYIVCSYRAAQITTISGDDNLFHYYFKGYDGHPHKQTFTGCCVFTAQISICRKRQ